jgi:hypothetical protein
MTPHHRRRWIVLCTRVDTNDDTDCSAQCAVRSTYRQRERLEEVLKSEEAPRGGAEY